MADGNVKIRFETAGAEQTAAQVRAVSQELAAMSTKGGGSADAAAGIDALTAAYKRLSSAVQDAQKQVQLKLPSAPAAGASSAVIGRNASPSVSAGSGNKSFDAVSSGFGALGQSAGKAVGALNKATQAVTFVTGAFMRLAGPIGLAVSAFAAVNALMKRLSGEELINARNEHVAAMRALTQRLKLEAAGNEESRRQEEIYNRYEAGQLKLSLARERNRLRESGSSSDMKSALEQAQDRVFQAEQALRALSREPHSIGRARDAAPFDLESEKLSKVGDILNEFYTSPTFSAAERDTAIGRLDDEEERKAAGINADYAERMKDHEEKVRAATEQLEAFQAHLRTLNAEISEDVKNRTAKEAEKRDMDARADVLREMDEWSKSRLVASQSADERLSYFSEMGAAARRTLLDPLGHTAEELKDAFGRLKTATEGASAAEAELKSKRLESAASLADTVGSDALSRVGGYLGGINSPAVLASRDTAENTRRANVHLGKIQNGISSLNAKMSAGTAAVYA